MTPEERTAVEPVTGPAQPVTLMNGFIVPEGRDEAFVELWTETSNYFRRQPVSFRCGSTGPSLRIRRTAT